jgi:hypothetical protein
VYFGICTSDPLRQTYEYILIILNVLSCSTECVNSNSVIYKYNKWRDSLLSSQRYSVLIPAFCALVAALGLGPLCATLNCPLSSSRTLCCMSLPTSARTWHTCYLTFPQPCSCMISVRCRSVCRVIMSRPHLLCLCYHLPDHITNFGVNQCAWSVVKLCEFNIYLYWFANACFRWWCNQDC